MKLLDGKIAVVYGAAGGVGGAVTKAFAREGATVFLAGRTLDRLTTLANDISEAGGAAEVARVDALDPQSVEEHLRTIIVKSGKLDISFNLISTGVGMGRSLTELSDEQFATAMFTLVRAHFITATAAARQMEKQGSGVILALSTSGAQRPEPNVGGFAIACAAIEALFRQLAVEGGPKGVRAISLRTSATPDNPVLHEVFEVLAKRRGTTREEVEKSEAKGTALKRLPRLPEVANAAAFLASDYASAITATTADATCGEMAS